MRNVNPWLILALFVLGAMAIQSSTAQVKPEPKPMVKWEYREASFASIAREERENRERRLNEWGGEGWELVEVHNGTCYLKRPKQ